MRHLVELHGGEVKARSEGPGKGAEFVVELPILIGRHSAELLEQSKSIPTPAKELCRQLR